MNELETFLARTYQDSSVPTSAGAAGVPVKIDDATAADHGHCRIYVTATGPATFELQLTNCPLTDRLQEFVESHDGTTAETPYGNDVTLSLSVTQVTVIRKLAEIIRKTVGRGQRYPDRNWKWICPRTADSLDRFATELMQFRRSPQSCQWRGNWGPISRGQGARARTS